MDLIHKSSTFFGGPCKIPFDGGLPCNVAKLIKGNATFPF